MFVLELVGLPGSGKTTACRELLDGLHDARPSYLCRHRKKLQNSILCRLFAPVAAVRFRGVLHEIARGEGRHALVNTLRSTATILVTHPARLRGGTDTSIDVQLFLAQFLMERVLTWCDAFLTGTALLHDEGYVQRALGVWLRTPPPVRERAWAAFLASVPAGIRCVHLDTCAEVALERSMGRAKGVPPAFARLVGEAEDAKSLHRVYEELGRLIRETSNRSPVEVSRLPGHASPEHHAAELIARFARGAPKRGVTVFLGSLKPQVRSASGGSIHFGEMLR